MLGAEVTVCSGASQDVLEVVAAELAEGIEAPGVLLGDAEGDEAGATPVGALAAGRRAVATITPTSHLVAASFAQTSYVIRNGASVLAGPAEVGARHDLAPGVIHDDHGPLTRLAGLRAEAKPERVRACLSIR